MPGRASHLFDELAHVLEQVFDRILQHELIAMRAAAAQVLLQQQAEALGDLGHMHLGLEAPEEGVADEMGAADGAAQQEAGKRRVVTGFVL